VHVGERLGPKTQSLVDPPILLRDRAGLIQKAEIRPFDVEAERGDGALVRRKGLEDAGKQELDRAGLGGEAGDPGDDQVGGLGSEEKVAVEVDR
jgi:hypothetical protein